MTFWIFCRDCGGDGSIEIACPQHDDPYFAVVQKCETCNGASYVEVDEPEQIEMEELP